MYGAMLPISYTICSMQRAKKAFKRMPGSVRKPFIFVLGFAVVGTGIVLLPLPGPGWLIIVAGFAILATEFEFAERIHSRLINFVKKSISYGKPAWQRFARRFKRWMRS
jgi:uncharacterized protein (TIGR02611 family)